jgi:hypothetical protein
MIADWPITFSERCILVMLRCARRTNNYRKISKVVNRRSVTNLLVPEVVTMTESTAAVAVVMAVVADEAEVVVVALEEEVVADGDDDSIELQKETTRRRCITAWSVFFGAIPNMRHGSEALGWRFVFFIHIPLLCF